MAAHAIAELKEEAAEQHKAEDRMRWMRDVAERKLVRLSLNLEVVRGAAGDATSTGIVSVSYTHQMCIRDSGGGGQCDLAWQSGAGASAG